MSRFVLKDAAAQMPARVKAPYRKVAILEMQEGYEEHTPTMISLRARGVQRIVYNSGALHARGVGCAWTLRYNACARACEILNKSLAGLAVQASGDPEELRKYVDEIVRRELEGLE